MSIKGYASKRNGKHHPIHERKGITEKQFKEFGTKDVIFIQGTPVPRKAFTSEKQDSVEREEEFKGLRDLSPDERLPILKRMTPEKRREALKYVYNISEEDIRNSVGWASHTFMSKKLAEAYGKGNLKSFRVAETTPYKGKPVWVVHGPTKHWIDEKYMSSAALADKLEENWTHKIIR